MSKSSTKKQNTPTKKDHTPKKVESEWNEEWIDTTFHTKNNFYHISNYGRIRSTTKATGDERIIKGAYCSKQVVLNVIQPDNSRGVTAVHNFVAKHFLKKPSEDHVRVIHLDEDYKNNKWVNLKWVTMDEWYEWNMNSKSYKEGRKKLLKNTYKLNITKVRLIKKRFKTGKINRRTIAKQFGISMRTVSRIEQVDYWNNIKIEQD